MFANDWDEGSEDDDHLPIEERGWYRRLMERKAARERFDREYPDFLQKMGRALAEQQTQLAIEILKGMSVDGKD